MKARAAGKIINIGSMSRSSRQLRAGLCREQRWHRAVHTVLRGGLGWRQHPGQCGAAGLDRYRPHRRARQEIDGLHDRVLARTPAARWGAISDSPGLRYSRLAGPDFVTGTAISRRRGYSIMADGIAFSNEACPRT